jgi:glyoxylase-like metal-dependent hydrolase (beta-lactamase superfamily II)
MRLPFEKGLCEIAAGHYAWLQPDGSWGYSNAGLVVDGEESLLVDTLFDERLTAEMLAARKDATGIGGADVTTLVNTHANGDHTCGNGLVSRAEIIASEASAKEMGEVPPERMAELLRRAPQMGDLGAFFLGLCGAFEIAGVKMRHPTRAFSGRLDLRVGDKEVQLMEVGPAHTAGDVLA